jgi:hypothetical protein
MTRLQEVFQHAAALTPTERAQLAAELLSVASEIDGIRPDFCRG